MKIVPDQIRQWVPGRFVVLGTDGYGRSDSRAQLRRHFEVDAQHIVVASLRALADEGKLDMATVKSVHEEVRHRSGQAESGDASRLPMAQDITVPDLGDFKDVEVIDVLVKPGDKIESTRRCSRSRPRRRRWTCRRPRAGVVEVGRGQEGRSRFERQRDRRRSKRGAGAAPQRSRGRRRLRLPR